jgi:hypothetical protein
MSQLREIAPNASVFEIAGRGRAIRKDGARRVEPWPTDSKAISKESGSQPTP